MMRRLVAALAVSIGTAAPVTAAEPDWTQARVIEVTLDDFSFAPSRLNLRHGEPYRLRLVNAGKGGHNFTARGLFRNSAVAPSDRATVGEGEIELPKGGAVELRFMPLKPGDYKIKCTHFMHGALGMRGRAHVD